MANCFGSLNRICTFIYRRASTMSMSTQNKASEGQVGQITCVVSHAAEKAVEDYIKEFGLDKEGAQRIHVNGNEVVLAVREAIFTAYSQLSTSQFKSIPEQVSILHKFLPNGGFADGKIAKRKLPKGAGGWLACPKWQTVASTYVEAVRKVANILMKSRNGEFYNEDPRDFEGLFQLPHVKNCFKQLAEKQNGYDILVLAAQSGSRRKNYSGFNGRDHKLFNANEFGLDTFTCAIMLLTHPEILAHETSMEISCPGDMDGQRLDKNDNFIPSFKRGQAGVGMNYIGKTVLEFSGFLIDYPSWKWVTASGFTM